MTLRARIVSQGDEIVSGATLDTNSNWLATRLSDLGARVLGTSSAADDIDALEQVLRRAAEDADLIVSTGGLGPTSDDLSADAAARAAGVPLTENPLALAQVKERFAHLGVAMAVSNLRQAEIPSGAEVLENRLGTAPGFALDIGGARAFFFPGVPRELYDMVPTHLDPWIAARGAVPLLKKRLHFCGLGESALQDRLRDFVLPTGVRLGFRTWLPYNTILLYADADLASSLQSATEGVRDRLGRDCFGEDDVTLAEVVGRALATHGLTVSLAESCTAGLAAALLTESPGSSRWFRGAVVAYANPVKRDLLAVPQGTIDAHGAVSEECAAAMAEGVRRVIGTDVGISITGIAGPDGGSDEKPVGMVCFGLSTPDRTLTMTRRYANRGRDVIRSLAAAHALEWLRRTLADR